MDRELGDEVYCDGCGAYLGIIEYGKNPPLGKVFCKTCKAISNATKEEVTMGNTMKHYTEEDLDRLIDLVVKAAEMHPRVAKRINAIIEKHLVNRPQGGRGENALAGE